MSTVYRAFSSTQSKEIVEQADKYHILKDSLKIHFNIIIAFTSLSGPFHLRFPEKYLYEFFIPFMYTTCSAFLIFSLYPVCNKLHNITPFHTFKHLHTTV